MWCPCCWDSTEEGWGHRGSCLQLGFLRSWSQTPPSPHGAWLGDSLRLEACPHHRDWAASPRPGFQGSCFRVPLDGGQGEPTARSCGSSLQGIYWHFSRPRGTRSAPSSAPSLVISPGLIRSDALHPLHALLSTAFHTHLVSAGPEKSGPGDSSEGPRSLCPWGGALQGGCGPGSIAV